MICLKAKAKAKAAIAVNKLFSPLTKQLIDALRGLPGIGPKSAQRMAFQLLSDKGRTRSTTLAAALSEASEHVRQCQRCRFYTEDALCAICSHPKRLKTMLCIVESPADVIALEQTHSYQGLYFVLQGHLSPLDGIGPNDIGLDHLFSLIKQEPVDEIIIATNATMEGSATAHYIAAHIDKNNITMSRIAHGVPMGGELEYLDGNTLSHAFLSRTPIE